MKIGGDREKDFPGIETLDEKGLIVKDYGDPTDSNNNLGMEDYDMEKLEEAEQDLYKNKISSSNLDDTPLFSRRVLEDESPKDDDYPEWVKSKKNDSGIDLRKLKEFFNPDDLEWRIQQSGFHNGNPWALVLAYVTNRAIMDRLDEVVGPDKWTNEFAPGPAGGVLCCISIKIGGEWIPKWDGADNTAIEEIKGGLSSAMKRAAVQWGIGRYLYKFPDSFAIFKPDGIFKTKIKDNKGAYHRLKWNPPEVPKWALPSNQSKEESPSVEKKLEDNTDLENKTWNPEAKKGLLNSGFSEAPEENRAIYSAIMAILRENFLTPEEKTNIKKNADAILFDYDALKEFSKSVNRMVNIRRVERKALKIKAE